MTKAEQTDFRQYCRQCTDTQLRNVYAKESLARRTAYAQIAKAVMVERGLA
jgi:hypothetical protein